MNMVEIIKDFYDTEHYITGCQCGGLEAEHIILSIEEKEEVTIVRWRNPETYGLSDCRYHYADQSVHTDTFVINNDVLSINDNTDIFWIWNDEVQIKAASNFLTKWNLKNVIAPIH